MSFFTNGSTRLRSVRVSAIPVLLQSQQPSILRLFSLTQPQFWKSARRWTQEELDTLKRLTERGKSDEEIGEALARSTKSVEQRRIRWRSGEGLTVGRKERSWTQQDDEKLCSLRDQGLSWREIASVFDSSVPAVTARWRHLHGLRRTILMGQVKTTRWSSLELEQLSSMSESKTTAIQIARKLNRPYRQVLHRLRTLKQERKHAVYSQEEDEQLARLKREGKRWEEIQLSMPWRTEGSLSHRYHRQPKSDKSLANPRKDWSEEEEATLRSLLKKGFSYRDIGARLGRTNIAIRSRAQVLKVGVGRPRKRAEQKQDSSKGSQGV